MSRVLVTGSLGNVGREVVRACAERGLAVRVAGRSEQALRQSFPGFEPVRFDFEAPETWPAALAGCDFVFLLRPPALANMTVTLNPFVDAAYAAGVRHIVFVSVAGADQMKWVPHRKVELHLEASGSAWTVLRPGFFAQNLQDAYRRDIVEEGRIFLPAAAGKVAFLDVRDAAEVTARILSAPEKFRGQALTLTGPEAIPFETVAQLLTQALGRPIRYQAASILGYGWHLHRQRQMPWMQIVVQTVLHVGLRRGGAEQVVPTVEQLLGRRPTSLAAYIERACATWQT